MMDANFLWHVGELGAVVGGAWIMAKMLAERVGQLEARLDKAREEHAAAIESVRADIRAYVARVS